MQRVAVAPVKQEPIYFFGLFGASGFVFARPVPASFGESPETLLEVGATPRSHAPRRTGAPTASARCGPVGTRTSSAGT